MQPLWRTVWRFLKKQKIELSYDPASPFLGIYPEKMKTLVWIHTCTPTFRAVLFTIAKTWKQPKCPSSDEWIKKIHTYTHTQENYSAIKEQWDNAICNNMDGPRDYHTKWSKSDRERQMISLICGILKKWYKGSYKIDIDSHRKQT